MNPLLDNMLGLVDSYRYFAVFFLTFLGAIALPIPTGSMMIACGFLATLGYFSLPELIIVGLLGNIVGDHAGYWIARKMGDKAKKLPLIGRLFSHTRFTAVSQHVHNSPFITIFTSRFMTAVAPSVNIVAGISKYPYAKFWIYEGLGEFTEVIIYTLLGWWFGNEWKKASEYVGTFWLIVAIGIGSSWLFWKWLNSKNKSSS